MTDSITQVGFRVRNLTYAYDDQGQMIIITHHDDGTSTTSYAKDLVSKRDLAIIGSTIGGAIALPVITGGGIGLVCANFAMGIPSLATSAIGALSSAFISSKIIK